MFGGWSGKGGVLESTQDLVRVGKCSNFKRQLPVLSVNSSHEPSASALCCWRVLTTPFERCEYTGHTHEYIVLFKFSNYWQMKYFLIIVYLHFFSVSSVAYAFVFPL